jgi:hypothetical protein
LLGFATWGGGATEETAAAKVEWSREGSVGCRRARPSPGLRRRPRGGEDWAVGRRCSVGGGTARGFCAPASTDVSR